MQQLWIVLLCSFWTTALNAQKGNIFSVKLNGKEIIKNKTLPEKDAIKCSLKRSALKTPNLITITIKEKEANPEWHRVFILYNNDEEFGREIQKTTSGNFHLKLRMPVDFKKGIIKVQTLLEPNDPNQAALVRLRTFPLFDLHIQ